MRKKILIVDDDKLILHGLSKALQNDAVSVVTAATAAEAIEQFGRYAFDLCMVDIHLPDFCGIDLMKYMKDAGRDLKCIVMTASFLDSRELSEKMKRVAEITDCRFLPKPFDLGEVRDLVTSALGLVAFSSGLMEGPKDEEPVLRRKTARRPFREEITFVVKNTGISDGESWNIMAKGTDISDQGGIGLISDFALAANQVLHFDKKLAGRSGEVVWRQCDHKGKCRAGIRFI